TVDELLAVAILCVTVLGTLGVCYLIIFILQRLDRRYPVPVFDSALKHLRAPALLLVPTLAATTALAFVDVGAWLQDRIRHGLILLTIAGFAWGAVRIIDVWQDMLSRRFRIDVADNLHARQVHTQIQVIRRIALVLATVVAGSAMLMTFPQVRAVGATLFASAGVAGLVVGLAARPAITNLLAGIQVALTEPIRIDDVVVVEGQWGRIEEIRTSYVVVRIWDLRRLVLPLSYFIEKPFENWTRSSANLLGTVMLYVDYQIDLDAVREEFQRILEGSPMWDRQVQVLQVTDATTQTLELRALMSAANSDDLWNLRCLVREKLILFVRAHQPTALPRTRLELDDTRGGSTQAPG
ncbi:MAG TPA: mechanosensitive ion channel domain-containing protein, partial [Gammaproteobacteria bacterium]|nr:mechanosensitive ion channel domain-containing protein [Gammaproteobacteria bacterium]